MVQKVEGGATRLYLVPNVINVDMLGPPPELLNIVAMALKYHGVAAIISQI